MCIVANKLAGALEMECGRETWRSGGGKRAVKEAISEKKNPAALLLYIAKNTPDDLWLTDLQIKGNELLIKVEALSYPHVGDFVSNISLNSLSLKPLIPTYQDTICCGGGISS